MAGAPVQFDVKSGNGQVNGNNSTLAVTDDDGVATVNWRLGRLNDPQRVEGAAV